MGKAAPVRRGIRIRRRGRYCNPCRDPSSNKLKSAVAQELLYLHSANVTMVTDTYREEQLAFIMNHAILFHH